MDIVATLAFLLTSGYRLLDPSLFILALYASKRTFSPFVVIDIFRTVLPVSLHHAARAARVSFHISWNEAFGYAFFAQERRFPIQMVFLLRRLVAVTVLLLFAASTLQLALPRDAGPASIGPYLECSEICVLSTNHSGMARLTTKVIVLWAMIEYICSEMLSHHHLATHVTL